MLNMMITGAAILGSTCLASVLQFELPIASAASKNTFSFYTNNGASDYS